MTADARAVRRPPGERASADAHPPGLSRELMRRDSSTRSARALRGSASWPAVEHATWHLEPRHALHADRQPVSCTCDRSPAAVRTARSSEPDQHRSF
eukprot:2570631-Prymnesium_polylepis.1